MREQRGGDQPHMGVGVLLARTTQTQLNKPVQAMIGRIDLLLAGKDEQRIEPTACQCMSDRR